MLGVDAVDSMLFGGNAAGREATFNAPDVVNNNMRKYDRDFDPLELSRTAGRAHTFGKPPRRMARKPQWDWVLPHCDEKDEWVDQIRKVMVALPAETKWLIHGYERCGVADVKRPMKEMLREALNHHDRVPHTFHAPPISGWVQHIVSRYSTLPDVLLFTPATVSKTSKVFTAAALTEAMATAGDFAVWGSHVVEMPQSLHTAFCAKIWPFAKKARTKPCPDRVVSMADAVLMVPRRRVQLLTLQTWKQLYDLIKGSDAESAKNAQLLEFGWHLLLGQPAALPHRASAKH